MSISSLYAAFGQESQITPEQRASTVEVALASRLAFSLSLPSQPVEGLTKVYAETCASLVRNQVSQFNEGFPINVQQTCDLVYSIWRYRYYLVHGRNTGFMRTIVAAAMVGQKDELNYELAPRYQAVIELEVPVEVDITIANFLDKTLPQ